jgi:hypothetical protein
MGVWFFSSDSCAHVQSVQNKKKGKQDDLNNYRRICLQGKIRLLIMLKEHIIEEQLGCQPLRGCRDALFIVRSALQIRHKHMQATWLLFVILVKAFDTIDQELLFEILAKFGIPQSMIYIIRRLYADMEIKITVGTEKGKLDGSQTSQQCDGHSPPSDAGHGRNVENADITSPEFCLHKEMKVYYGKMKWQNMKTKGTIFELFLSLYVDDGSFIFETKKDLKKGATILHHHMKCFGLLMHIDRYLLMHIGRDRGK